MKNFTDRTGEKLLDRLESAENRLPLQVGYSLPFRFQLILPSFIFNFCGRSWRLTSPPLRLKIISQLRLNRLRLNIPWGLI